MQSLVQSTKQKPTDTLQVHIFYGREKNEFTYYEDDGATFAYRDGHYCRRTITLDPGSRQIVFGTQEGDYPSGFNHIGIILHGFPAVAGFQPYTRRLVDADPSIRAQTRTIGNSKERLIIKW